MRVWTCLSRAVGRGSSPWTLLVVTIDRVSTMQLYVWEVIVWLILLSHRRRQLMMPKKSPMCHTILACLRQYLHNKKRRPSREHRCGADQILSEGKVRISHNSRVPELGWIMRTCFLRVFGLFVSSVEPNSYACATSLFLIGKIFINVRILPNPPHIRILFILGFYGLWLFVEHKSFPFRISWRSHNDQFSAMWPFNPSTLVCSYSPFVWICHL